jgi:hypothetical protein
MGHNDIREDIIIDDGEDDDDDDDCSAGDRTQGLVLAARQALYH